LTLQPNVTYFFGFKKPFFATFIHIIIFQKACFFDIKRTFATLFGFFKGQRSKVKQGKAVEGEIKRTQLAGIPRCLSGIKTNHVYQLRICGDKPLLSSVPQRQGIKTVFGGSLASRFVGIAIHWGM
jgi:hypothetical protein